MKHLIGNDKRTNTIIYHSMKVILEMNPYRDGKNEYNEITRTNRCSSKLAVQ